MRNIWLYYNSNCSNLILFDFFHVLQYIFGFSLTVENDFFIIKKVFQYFVQFIAQVWRLNESFRHLNLFFETA